MGNRAVIFVPEDGGAFGRRYTRECQEQCDRSGQEIVAVTANAANVWVMMEQGRADVVVVAREAHLRWLVREEHQVVRECRRRPYRGSRRNGQ